jgi:hypothetical protein
MEKLRIMENEYGSGLILAMIFLIIAISLGIVAIWGIMAMNIWATVIGFVGEGAWIFAGKNII